MSLRSTLESHPMFSLLSAAVTVASLTASVVGFFMNARLDRAQDALDGMQAACQQQVAAVKAEQASLVTSLEQRLAQQRDEQAAAARHHQQQVAGLEVAWQQKLAQEQARGRAEVDEFQRRLAVYKQGVGQADDYFDVNQLFIPPQEIRSKVPWSKPLEEGAFLARLPSANDAYTYELTTELKLQAELAQVSEAELANYLGEQAAAAATALPMHLWRSQKRQAVQLADGSSLQLGDMIVVQRAAHHKVQAVFARLLPAAAQAEHESPAQQPLFQQYQQDPAGTMLTLLLMIELQQADAGLQVEIERMQKLVQTAYVELRSRLGSAIVNGTRYPEYYLLRRVYVISTPDDMYIIKTTVPTADYETSASDWVKAWFHDFRIVVQRGRIATLPAGPR